MDRTDRSPVLGSCLAADDGTGVLDLGQAKVQGMRHRWVLDAAVDDPLEVLETGELLGILGCHGRMMRRAGGACTARRHLTEKGPKSALRQPPWAVDYAALAGHPSKEIAPENKTLRP